MESNYVESLKVAKTTQASRKFKPVDMTIPVRLIGSNEYFHALDSFLGLVKDSAKSEIKVYDELIAAQNEFSYYSGLSIATANGWQPEQLETKARGETGEQFKRHSLAWMMALARVELGATIAMYGNEVPHPFMFIAPEDFGRKEYFELVMDDAAAHLNALETDPMLIKKTRLTAKGDSNTLAYLRRLSVVHGLVNASDIATEGAFSESADVYKKKIKKYGLRLAESAEMSTYDKKHTQTEVSEKYSREVDYRDVTARSPLIYRCQQLFLARYLHRQ